MVLLGLCSLFTDISAEMVATVLPLYLIYTVGFNPLQFGLLDGLYQGATTLVRIAGGFVGDRSRRHKDVAATGYGISAACKLALVAVGSAFSAIALVVFLDRIGKGIRTAPRDALISLSSRGRDLGAAFGVHRALDTTGALLGPLVAFGLLALAPLAFDSIFVVSFCFALVGLGILVLLVDNPARAMHAGPKEAGVEKPPGVSFRSAAGLLRSRSFASLVVVAALLGLVTVSDAFIYLVLQRRLDLDATFFPLLFMGTALLYMVLAAPVGRLADRLGRGRVFLCGYALLLAIYAAVILPVPGGAALVICVGLLGAFYAATDGVLMALASSVISPELRGSGLAIVSTATGLARLLASIAFGLLWTLVGVEPAIIVFACALVPALAAAGILLRSSATADA